MFVLGLDEEPRIEPVGLGRFDRPGLVRIGRRHVARTFGRSFRRHAEATDAVGEPTGVGDFVERVDVHGFPRGVDRKETRDRSKDQLVRAVPDERRKILFRLFVERTPIGIPPHRILQRVRTNASAAARDQRKGAQS